MTVDDWILALHVLSAFALVAAIVVLWCGYLAVGPGGEVGAALGRLFRVGSVVLGVGAMATLVFGVWLAISIDGYEPWDGWIVAAIVLWVIGTGTSERAGRLSQQAGTFRQAIGLHAIASVTAILILVDMLWKPGA